MLNFTLPNFSVAQRAEMVNRPISGDCWCISGAVVVLPSSSRMSWVLKNWSILTHKSRTSDITLFFYIFLLEK